MEWKGLGDLELDEESGRGLRPSLIPWGWIANCLKMAQDQGPHGQVFACGWRMKSWEPFRRRLCSSGTRSARNGKEILIRAARKTERGRNHLLSLSSSLVQRSPELLKVGSRDLCVGIVEAVDLLIDLKRALDVR
jgi:hypothetical protein